MYSNYRNALPMSWSVTVYTHVLDFHYMAIYCVVYIIIVHDVSADFKVVI